MSKTVAGQLVLFAGEPAEEKAEEKRPAGREPTLPPEGFKPDLKRGLAWCPYCGEAREFAWDQETWYIRCPECGVSAEDFYTKAHNKLWQEKPMKEFAEAVRKSGRTFSGAPAAPEGPAPRTDARPEREARAETPWKEVWCPECGRFIRAAYPPVRLRCQRCGSLVFLGEDGALNWEPPQDAARCRRCGRLLEEHPRPGVAYWCWSCGLWSAAPGDRKGEKEAEAANAALPKRRARKGPLPGPVLTRVRDLVSRECADYQASGPFGIRHYCALEPAPDCSCVFFAKDAGRRRCREFEEGVLPLERDLEEAYWRRYEEPQAPEGGGQEGRAGGGAGEEAAAGKAKRAARRAAREARKVLEEAREKREKVCAYCQRPFIPKNNFGRYCSEEHRKAAWRDKDRERKKKKSA